jgi:hypothetical protein
MSQSTPINLIRRGGGGDQQPMNNMPPPMDPSLMQDPMQMGGGMSGGMGRMESMGNSDSQLVEDILKEMGDSPGAEQMSNINNQAFHYTMDSSQVPPNKYVPPNPIPEMNETNYTQKMMMDQQPNNLLAQIGINLNGESVKEKITKNMKYPLLVFVLCFIISLPEFNRFLFGFFPKLLLESGQISIGGIILKSFIGMMVFIIVSLFL